MIKEDKIKITIAVPSNRGLIPATFQCLLELIAQSNKYNLHIIVPEHGYTIAENRNYIAAQACQNKSDYLLMIDDDMTFPPNMLDKLIKNDKDICGLAFHSRGGTATGEIMAIAEVTEKKFINLDTETDPKYKDVFECHAVGTGIILIKTEIFHKIPSPWFEFTYKESGQCENGEDWNFCFKAKRNNYKIWTDPTIEVGHIGEKIYE